MINAEPKPALMPGFPFDGIGEHLIDHRFALAVVNGHLRATPRASAVAKIVRMTAPMHKRLGQEIAGSKQHGPKCGRIVFGIKPVA